MGQLVNIRSFKLYYKIIWNSSWNFSGKYAYITNIMEDVYLEKYISVVVFRFTFFLFFFSHLRIEKYINNYFFDIFFFDDIAAIQFNNSLVTKNNRYRFSFLNKFSGTYQRSKKYLTIEEYSIRKSKFKDFLVRFMSKNLFKKTLGQKYLNKNFNYFFYDILNINSFNLKFFNRNNKFNSLLMYSTFSGSEVFNGLNYKSLNYIYMFKFMRKIDPKKRPKGFFNPRQNNKEFYLNIINFKTRKVFNLVNGAYYSYRNNLIKNMNNSYFLLNYNNLNKKVQISNFLFFRKINYLRFLFVNYYFNTNLSLDFKLLKNNSSFFGLIFFKKYFKFFNFYLNIFNFYRKKNILFLKKAIYSNSVNSFDYAFKKDRLNILNIDILKYLNRDNFFNDIYIYKDSSVFFEDKFNFNYFYEKSSSYFFFINDVSSDIYLQNRLSYLSGVYNSFLPNLFFKYLEIKPKKIPFIEILSERIFRSFCRKFKKFKLIRDIKNKLLNLKFKKKFLILNLFHEKIKIFYYVYLEILKYLKKMHKNNLNFVNKDYINFFKKGLYSLHKKIKINNLKYLNFFNKLMNKKIFKKIKNLFRFNFSKTKSRIKDLKLFTSKNYLKTLNILVTNSNFAKGKPHIYRNKHLLALGFYKEKTDNNFIDKKKLNKKKKKTFFYKFYELIEYVKSVNGLTVRQNIKNNYLMSICFFLFFSSSQQLSDKLKILKLFLKSICFKFFNLSKKKILINFFLLKDPTPEIVSLYIKNTFYVELSLPSLIKPLVHTIIRNFTNICGVIVKCKGRFTRQQRASKFAFISGKVPLNNFDAYILYYHRTRVFLTGLGSIKVWMSYKSKLSFKKINI